jgi:hypothetical protein
MSVTDEKHFSPPDGASPADGASTYPDSEPHDPDSPAHDLDLVPHDPAHDPDSSAHDPDAPANDPDVTEPGVPVFRGARRLIIVEPVLALFFTAALPSSTLISQFVYALVSVKNNLTQVRQSYSVTFLRISPVPTIKTFSYQGVKLY